MPQVWPPWRIVLWEKALPGWAWRFPPPLEGQFVAIRSDPRDGQDWWAPLVSPFDGVGLLWETPLRTRRVEPTDGFIIVGVESCDLTWMPPGWSFEPLIPLDFTRAHLDRWFQIAVRRVEELVAAGRDPALAVLPSRHPAGARDWVAAAFALVRHLGLPDSPAEPRTPIDPPGCAAALRDAWTFIDRAMGADPGRTAVGRKAGKTARQRRAKLRQAGRPTLQEDGPAGDRYLRYQGREFDIPQGVIYRLIKYMWPPSRERATQQELVHAEVLEAVLPPKSIRARASEAGKALGMAGVPWRLSTAEGGDILEKCPRK
jgi:hypothetical protein